MKNELYQKEIAIDFYEYRYEKGYMDEWPVEKKQRVFELLRSLPLPETGEALDYGCGNGVFTDLLRQALPKWKIYGSDISQNAINNAKIRFPECTFFVSDNDLKSELKFDFLFSHHVLEHVFDIEKAMEEINNYLKPQAYIMHILPCGNEGSFEYDLCKLRVDGFNESMENRFFFEDEGHVRRLTTEKANALIQVHGFTLEKEFYSNQYHGAIKWITQSSASFIKNFANPEKGKDANAKTKLANLRTKFLFLAYLQLPYALYKDTKAIKNKKPKHYIVLLAYMIPSLISYPIHAFINAKAAKEWNTNNQAKNGSEMYVFYSRK
ncbi:MAG: class I SAM-dependent methyltransferase [Bacteroidota bacterium]